ncbi:alpha/beta hydrolase fold domain-containing protein [Lacrimispora saccharolytica]|uniref:Alpha/beta hydrolase fold-3 domain protein n=1 Tax=Lacrimispora saccharolytica (strain ATCC 35040 / DSM 2544 / NRCC 2533 / WM1) TaxID=610130 RepID=D9R2X4_LACSW|nr:alpha/beta hydrolase [Lacrimispora saccharolytica]ADL02964.1 alpha/beta hydrolase fold-3 domain protein [[Clostridium] saccharolyticum WM1]QRV18844.1 alpha/beta hydrolase [Lacrimispora saccharolytica]
MSMKTEMARIFAGLNKSDRKMALELEHPARGTAALDQERFTKRVRVKAWNVDGFPAFTINGSYTKAAHVLMLPGGAYTLEPSGRYREMAEHFAIEKQVRVTIPLCPLAPEYTALDAHRYLVRVYSFLAAEYPEDEFFLFGDFSGGGLALSLLQELRDTGNLPMPVRTAVVSPWLDIALSNPKIKIVKKSDPILPVEALKEAGVRYRGPLEPDHPFVSPLYGNWDHLGQILVFSGTEEILTPDCELLAEMAGKLQGTEIIYRKGARMIHDWILIPCKETDATLDLIFAFFLEEALGF